MRTALALASLLFCGVARAQEAAVAPKPETPQQLTPSAYDASDDIFYQFMPISWRYGEAGEGVPQVAKDNRFGNFQGMIDSLPYLKSLGVTAVWMTPIFPSAAYHGYQHGRADQINPWFGSEADFLRFVREAKGAGIKVFLDLVTYGISQDSEWFKDAYQNPASPATKLLAFTDDKNSKFAGYSFRTWDGDKVGFINWDLRNADARSLVISWSKKWLDPNGDGDPSDGIAGYRLDHVVAPTSPAGGQPSGTKPAVVGDGPSNTWGYDNGFWMEWKKSVQQVNPAVFTFAEQANWASFGDDLLAAHDAAFTKPFEAAAREAILAEDATKLYESMAATFAHLPKDGPKGRTLLLTLGDHDVDRLASAIGADTFKTFGRAKAAAAVLMLGPLPPCIYYGDELGMLGKGADFKSDANDIPRREPMKWKASDGPPMTHYYALHKGAYDGRFEHDHDGRSVEEQDKVRGSLLETYRELAKLRAKLPALRRGNYEPLRVETPSVWMSRRVWMGQKGSVGQILVTAINLGEKPQTVDVRLAGVASVSDVIDGEVSPAMDAAGRAAYSVTIPAYGYRIVILEPK